MSFDIIKFFRPSYFFALRTTISHQALVLLTIVFGLLILMGVVFAIISHRLSDGALKKLFRRYYQLTLSFGFLGFLLLWLRYEAVPFLSARFWLVVWLGGGIAWLVRILQYQFKVVPLMRRQAQEKIVFNQYLPRKK